MIKDYEQGKRLDRIANLHQIVVDGADAEAVYKYAYKLKKEYEQDVITALQSSNRDITIERTFYQVACKFCEMLESAARLGKQKSKTLAEIRE